LLTDTQIDHFKAEGYVILSGFFATAQIEAWHDIFWTHVGARADEPKTWPDSYVIDGLALDPVPGGLPPMQAIIEQLSDGMFGGGGGSMLIQWPKPDQDWQLPGNGHIDGYGPGGWSGGFMLGATTYLEDVEARGGAFIYWPQSHLSTQEYFREFPEQIDGSFRERDDWDERTWAIFSDRSPQGPLEFVGAAGDLILWHAFLCHTGSANVNSRPRQAVFSRWHRSDREQMRYDIPEDLWKYWAI
jgi:hypothetical protein